MPLGVWTLRKHSVIEKTRHNSRPEDSLQTSGGPGTLEDGCGGENHTHRPALQMLRVRSVSAEQSARGRERTVRALASIATTATGTLGQP